MPDVIANYGRNTQKLRFLVFLYLNDAIHVRIVISPPNFHRFFLFPYVSTCLKRYNFINLSQIEY